MLGHFLGLFFRVVLVLAQKTLPILPPLICYATPSFFTRMHASNKGSRNEALTGAHCTFFNYTLNYTQSHSV
jgi:hypothetical protein